MTMPSQQKAGFSLIELIVVIAIFAVLLGLILVAIQKVREAAIRTENNNNIRQIMLGVHQIASEKQGDITDLTRSSMKGVTYATHDHSLFYRLLPYVHNRGTFHKNMTNAELDNWLTPVVKVYRNPADPSWDLHPGLAGSRCKCSYAFNMLALDGSLKLGASLPDGTSQTMALADKYYVNGFGTPIGQSENIYNWIFDPREGEPYGSRRATFADRGWFDVMPITDPTTRMTRPSVPGKTFQVKPQPAEIDPHILQTPFSAGLTVAMFDGSVRTISPSVSENVFWGLVTPNGGEVLGDY